jgi:hypothetical protein
MSTEYRLPKSMRYICFGFQMLTVLLALLSAWTFYAYDVIDQLMDVYWNRVSEDARSAITYSPVKKAILQSLATASYFAPVLILVGTFRIFGALKSGDPLRQQAVRAVRFLGGSIAAYALSRIAIYPASVMAMTYDNPANQKELSIAVDTSTLIVLMIGVALIMIGHIFIHAVKIAEENRQFV